jgi:hypothetical protein
LAPAHDIQEQDLMPLQAKPDALTSAHDAASDPSVTALREATMKLIDDEEHARPLKAGDLALRFKLPSYDDLSVVLDELLKTGPLVLTFYRGLWCPFCQQDLRNLDQLIESNELNNCVLAIYGRANRVTTTRAILNSGLISRCSRTLQAIWLFNIAFAGRPKMHA